MMRTGEDEERSPKYSHIERERRWLVNPGRLPAFARAAYILIEDRYISGSRLRLRKMSDPATGSVALKLTKKYEAQDPLARPIVTAYLTPAEYALLQNLPAVQLSKRRYALEGSGFTVDHFEGPLSGLVLAEIECPSQAELTAIAKPEWASREVTHDVTFQGHNLAALGADGLASLLAQPL